MRAMKSKQVDDLPRGPWQSQARASFSIRSASFISSLDMGISSCEEFGIKSHSPRNCIQLFLDSGFHVFTNPPDRCLFQRPLHGAPAVCILARSLCIPSLPAQGMWVLP